MAKIARETTGQQYELFFFQRLRHEVRSSLRKSPNLIQFNGSRECVKRIVGAERWCNRCRWMHDQIVSYLRNCLEQDSRENCALVIR